MTDKVQKIREVLEKRYEYWKEKEHNSHSVESEIRMSECQHLLQLLNSLPEEPKEYDLVKFADWQSIEYRNQRESCGLKDPITLDEVEEANYAGVMAGAQWQKQRLMKDAINATVWEDSGGYPYIDKTIEMYDYDKDIPLAK